LVGFSLVAEMSMSDWLHIKRLNFKSHEIHRIANLLELNPHIVLNQLLLEEV
jgi:hypothetical protein